MPSGPEVEVTFRSATDRVDFKAELDNGQVRIRVRVRAGDGGFEDAATSTSTSASSGSTPSLPDSTPTSVGASTSTSLDDSPSTTIEDSTSTTMDDSTSTTVDDSTSTTIDDDHDTTSTTVDDSTSTTIDDSADFGTKVFDVNGIATVTVERDANGLTLVAVVSQPGWTIDVKKADAHEIEVEFHNGSQEVKFKAEIEGGMLKIEVHQESQES